MSELEEQIGQWRSFVSKHREVSASDADELELKKIETHAIGRP